jgi:hypothetical protein
MTVLPDFLLVEFPGPDPDLRRSLPSVDVFAPRLLRRTLPSGFPGARRISRPLAPTASASPGRSATGKKRFNTQ